MLNSKYCNQAKLIVCVLARGQSRAVLAALKTSAEHILATGYVSIRSQSGTMNTGKWDEMDSLHITVTPEYAESIFEKIYHQAEIDTCEGAYMYQMDVPWITPFELPNIPAEGVAISSLNKGEVLPEGVDEKTAEALRIFADIDVTDRD